MKKQLLILVALAGVMPAVAFCITPLDPVVGSQVGQTLDTAGTAGLVVSARYAGVPQEQIDQGLAALRHQGGEQLTGETSMVWCRRQKMFVPVHQAIDPDFTYADRGANRGASEAL